MWQINIVFVVSLISREQQLSGFVFERRTLWGESPGCAAFVSIWFACRLCISVTAHFFLSFHYLVIKILTQLMKQSFNHFLPLVPFSPLYIIVALSVLHINNTLYILCHIGPGVRVQMLVSTWFLWEILPKCSEALWQRPLSARRTVCGEGWKDHHLQLSHGIFRSLLWGWTTFIDVILRLA